MNEQTATEPTETSGQQDGTEAWRLMSARAAWYFWSADRRLGMSPDPETDLELWESEADAFRQVTRTALRALEAEGIMLRAGMPHVGLLPTSREWYLASARIARILWLIKQRQSDDPDTHDSTEAWEKVSQREREVARKALCALENQNIQIIDRKNASTTHANVEVSDFLSVNRVSSFTTLLKSLKAAGHHMQDAIDGGAGAGHTSTQIIESTRVDSICYAFEPFPGNHRFFEGLSDNIVLMRKALGATNKVSSFSVSSTVSEQSEWGSRGMKGYSSVGFLSDTTSDGKSTIDVKCVRADDALPQISKIDFIKLDLQGGELAALQGMPRILSKAKLLWVEFSGQPGLLEYLDNAGFVILDTQYFFLGKVDGSVLTDFSVSQQDVELSTGQNAWFGHRKKEWPNFYRCFLANKGQFNMVQTDLAAVRKDIFPEFKQAVEDHLRDEDSGKS